LALSIHPFTSFTAEKILYPQLPTKFLTLIIKSKSVYLLQKAVVMMQIFLIHFQNIFIPCLLMVLITGMKKDQQFFHAMAYITITLHFLPNSGYYKKINKPWVGQR
jgi:hypothetical protein